MDTTKQPMAELVIRSGEHLGQSCPLNQPVTILGRAEGCDLLLPRDGIAPVHCLILLDGDRPRLRAFPGTSVRVNDQSGNEWLLQHGDRLEIGPCQFDFLMCDPPATLGGLLGLIPDSDTLSVASEPRQAPELAEWEKSLGALEHELNQQRDHLIALRRRLIRRWKAHWSTRRREVERMVSEVEADRRRFHQHRASQEIVQAESQVPTETAIAVAESISDSINTIPECIRQELDQHEQNLRLIAEHLEEQRGRLVQDMTSFLAMRKSFRNEALESSRELEIMTASLLERESALAQKQGELGRQFVKVQEAVSNLGQWERVWTDRRAQGDLSAIIEIERKTLSKALRQLHAEVEQLSALISASAGESVDPQPRLAA